MRSLFTLILVDSQPFTPEDFLKKLFPNFWSFLINLIALIILFILVYWIAYKPLKKYIQARKDYVEHNIRDSERAKAINEKKVAEGDKIISDAKGEANNIILKAKSDATVSAEGIVNSAKAEAQERQKAADEAIKQAEAKSKKAIHDEIVNVAMDASKAVLGREVTSKDNAKLIDDFISGVKKDGK